MVVKGNACQVTKVTMGLTFGNEAIPEKGSRNERDTPPSKRGAGAGVTVYAGNGMKPLLALEQDAIIIRSPRTTDGG